MMRWHTLARPVAARLGPGLLQVTFGLVALLGLLTTALQLSRVTMLSEAGYGDSYVLYDVQHFQRTGRVYRDLSFPPYLPANYSPLLYILLSLPNKALQHPNPFVGPRVMVIAAFIGCVITTVSITRALIPGFAALFWALGLALSVSAWSDWLLQIRVDFFATLCSLLSLRLLISRSGSAVVLAGVFAGAAVLFKFTLVAAAAAGLFWLASQRRWIDAAYFAGAAAVAAFAPYLAYQLYEPQMLSQMFSLSPGIPDLRGSVRLVTVVLSEPLIPLAVVGIPAACAMTDHRRTAVLSFCSLSGAVAAATALHAGANINYYFEFFLAAVPLAVFGLIHLQRLSRRFVAVGVVIAYLVTQYVIVPRALGLRELANSAADDPTRDAALGTIQQILGRYRTLSTLPRFAMMDPAPTLVDPFLLTYLVRLKKTDPTRLIADVTSHSFDGILTNPRRTAWRRVSLLEESLGSAIARSYVPTCVYRPRAQVPFVLHLPAGVSAADSRLAQELGRIGCQPIGENAP